MEIVVYFFIIFIVPVLVSFNPSIIQQNVQVYISLSLTLILALDTLIEHLTNDINQNDNNILPLFASFFQKLQFKFWVDLISVIPFDVLFLKFSRQKNSNILEIRNEHKEMSSRIIFEALLMFRFFRITQVGKVAKSSHYLRIMIQLRQVLSIRSAKTSILFYMFTMGIFLHFHACSMFLFGKILLFEDESWQNPNTHLNSLNVWSQYSFGWWAAVANTFPVNGNFIPSLYLEQWVATVMTLMGVIVLARMNGSISAFTLASDPCGRNYKEYLDEVGEWMKTKKIPNELRAKVYKYYQRKYL
ncbi:anaphase-promoting complex subunit Hcn1, partial [Nowakowskiella sp. JEL0078]